MIMMKHILSTLGLGLILCTTGAFADDKTPVPFLVVDQMLVMQNCKAGRAFTDHQKEMFAKYEEITNKEKEALGKKGQEIEEKLKTSKVRDANLERMGQEEFQKAEKKFMETYQQRQKTVSDTMEKANAAVAEAIIKVLTEYKKEKNVSAIFAKGAVLVCDDSKDITQEIIKRVDIALPSINIKIPSPKE